MTARQLEHNRDALGARVRRLREAATTACASGAATGFAATFSPRLAIAFGVATVVAAGMVVAARHARDEYVARLALDDDAYSIPEVAAYGQRCARKRERERLAEWIRRLIADRNYPGQSLHLADRVARYAHDLEGVASEMATAARVRPPAAVACRRLLTHAVESPLYNPQLPAEELSMALERIRRGIRVG